MKQLPRLTAACAAIFLPFLACGQSPDGKVPAAQQSLGGARFENWTGLNLADDAAVLKLPGEAVYHAAGAGKSQVLDVSPWYGLRFDLELDRDDAAFAGEWTISQPPIAPGDRQDMVGSTKAPVRIQGKGWHTVTLPFSGFDYYRGQSHVLKGLAKLALTGRYEGRDDAGQVRLRNVRLVLGNYLHVSAELRSRPADADGTVAYTATVTNCTDAPRIVTLSLERTGWEGMPATVQPGALTLAPGQSENVTITVTAPGWLPAGAREAQTLVATPQDDPSAAEKLGFITIRRVPFPFLVHTPAEWDDVRANTTKYDWAKTELADYVRQAAAFQVPAVRPPSVKGVFEAYIERKVWPCAVAWKLAGDRPAAEKVALFLRRLSDPATGYPSKQMAQSADIPQEGGLWEVAAWGYDMIQDANILTDDDKRQIEESFRRYAVGNANANGYGGISNWSVFNLCPAAQCALVVHDMVTFDEIMHGPSGVIDHLRYGTMDDGWWYEMALGYNLGCAEAFTNLGLAARSFGINFLHEGFPVATTQIVGLRPFEFQNFKGMAFGKYGPVRDNTISVKKMWDGIVSYPDYRGIIFGIGDGHEEEIGARHFDKAYFAFRDPAYASIVKQSSRRDLIYAVPDLPIDTPQTYASSGHSDDAGVAVLRSQTPNRPPREQIQAVLKYGTHGSYHGHFDRLALNSLMRYGRSFYNPETSWYGYTSYMYKWWVQSSMAHNMVVVDDKMQEPKECKPLLFHSGTMMQVSAAETDARWSNPPYLGGYDQSTAINKGDLPYVPIPVHAPLFGAITDYTEPVHQRRVVIVTDDYVVLADDLRSEHEHTFDDCLDLRGANLADPAQVQFLRHDAQFDPNPLGSGQFITNVSRYAITAPTLIQSVHRVGQKGAGMNWGGDKRHWETGGASSLSEPGVLQIDARVLWPQKAELAVGDYPENWPVAKKLDYEVQGDGKPLASGTFGAWILGCGQVDVDITGMKTLRLATTTNRDKNTRNTLFWGNPVVITTDGKEIPLAQLKRTDANISPVPQPDRDYESGPVRIVGVPYDASLPAEPQNARSPGVTTVDLEGVNAVRFKSAVGGDWPVGDEEQLRKVVAVRTRGSTARFLTLLEPFETQRTIKSAVATSDHSLRVEFADGRAQEITVTGLDGSGAAPVVQITETKDEVVVRNETTATKLSEAR